MKITLTALSVKFLFGRNLVTCVPRDEAGKQLTPELPLSTVLSDLKRHGHELANAQEVLECIVSQHGFAA